MAKRKLEGASPVPKQRKTTFRSKRRESTDSEVPEDHDSDAIFVGEEPIVAKPVKNGKTGRRLEPARLPKAVEYAKDAGRTESKHFLAATMAASEQKQKAAEADAKYMVKFRDDVKAHKQALGKRIQDLNSPSSKQDSEFLSVFKTAFTSTYETTRASGENNNSQSFISNHAECQKMLKAALQLIARFEEVASHVSTQAHSSLPRDRWLEEEKRMDYILQKGKEHGEKKVESILLASKEPEMDKTAARAVALLHPGPDNRSEGWGKFAKKQGKTFERIIRKNMEQE